MQYDNRFRNRIFGCLLVLALLVPASNAQPAQAQDQPFTGCSGEVEERKKMEQFSLYYENYKNEDYGSALPFLRWILNCAPAYGGPNRLTDNNFERAIKAYDALAGQTEEPVLAQAYRDTVLILYDRALPVLREAGVEDVDPFSWTFKKGYYLQSNLEHFPAYADSVGAIYQAAYEIEPERVKPYYVDFIIADYLRRAEMGLALDFIREVGTRFSDQPEYLEIVEKYIKQIPPQERIAFYEQRLEQDSANLDVIKALVELYKDMGNMERVMQLGEKLLTMEPTAEVLRLMSDIYLKNAQYAKAFGLYQKLLKEEGVDPKAEDYYNMGVAQQQMGSPAQARSYYRKALSVDPQYGRAYLAIGDLYANAVSACGSMEREDRAVYWLATDYYEKARSVDASLRSVADQKISTYRNYYPTKEDLFFWGKGSGDSYKVDYGCYSWIGETTKVR